MKKFVKYLAVASFLASDVCSAHPCSVEQLTTKATTMKLQASEKMAAGIFIMDQTGTILACSRKDARHLFGLPGGKLELGDTYFMAALRETREETGVTYSQDQLTPVFMTLDGPVNFVTFTLTDGLLANRPNINPGDGEGECKWISPYEFIVGAFPHYNSLLLMVLPPEYKKHYQDKSWYKKLAALGYDKVDKMSNDDIRTLLKTTGDV